MASNSPAPRITQPGISGPGQSTASAHEPRAHIGANSRRIPWPAFLAALLFLVIGFGSFSAVAQTFPALTGRVVDEAGLLDPAAEAALTQQLATFEEMSSDQVVVATIPDLQGYDIADYANRLARQWAIGQQEQDNGVLLIVARDDRKVRIEVGYGLEGSLTDALSSLIVQTDILPAFKSGDFPGGIQKGVDGILQVLSGDAAEMQARAETNMQWSEDDFAQIAGWLFPILFVGIWITVAALVMATRMARSSGKKIGPNRYRWLGIIWTLDRVARSGGGGFGGGGFKGRSSGGGFSGGGGSFGGGGSSGSW